MLTRQEKAELQEQDREIEKLRMEEDLLTQRSKNEEKKALIREYKKRYGRDWKKYFRWAKDLKVDKDSLSSLHGIGDSSGERLRGLTEWPPRR